MKVHGRCISGLLLASVIFFFLCNVSPSSALCYLHDQDSLLSLSSNVSSRTPLNWNISNDCCSWEGINCDDYGRVTRLWLPSRRLHGTLSPSIANLSRLAQLNLSHNLLSGPVPDNFFQSLNRIQIVDLSFNQLSGNIHASDSLPLTIETLDLSSNQFVGEIQSSFLGKALNLVKFNLSNNSFSGPFPLFICNYVPSITVLDFSYNYISRSIGFGRCSNLKVLRGAQNALAGPFPDDLFSMTSLEILYLPGNRLSGPIGEGIGNLINLKILALHGNEFTGAIPWNIGRLLRLEVLLLHVNKLIGSLPTTLRNCTRLTSLNLRQNLLTGELSSFDFSRFLQLSAIDLGNNLFNGTFPVTLSSCLSLTAIRLSASQLVGEIPEEIQALQSLSFLSVSNNSLVNIRGAVKILSGFRNLSTLVLSNNFYGESFPDSKDLLHFKGFQSIQLLALGGCQFTGNFPDWFSGLPKLKVLDLSMNGFTGEPPGWLGNLPSLFYLDLSHNFFSGSFPTELTKLPNLASQQVADWEYGIVLELPVFVNPNFTSAKQYNRITRLPPAVYLNNNKFSGLIPMEIGLLKLLHVLDLSNNSFSGSIPNTISELTNLEKLDLSANHLQGEIPASLKNLHFLSAFSVANNILEGPIPTGGQFDTFPSSSFEGNPGLCGKVLQRSCSRIFPTPQPPIKETVNWLSFHSGFGLGFGLSFIVTVVTFAMWCSWRSRKSRRVHILF